jgi:hypothetical protein
MLAFHEAWCVYMIMSVIKHLAWVCNVFTRIYLMCVKLEHLGLSL